MTSYHLTAPEKSRYLAEYCRHDPRAALRLERMRLDVILMGMKVVRTEHAPRAREEECDLGKLGVPRRIIEALENADTESNAAKAYFAWRAKKDIRGRAYGLLLCGESDELSVAAAMAIDPRYTKNESNHTRRFVAESTLISDVLRRDGQADKYRDAHVLVVDSVGCGAMFGRQACESSMELLRKRWEDYKTTILTSSKSLLKLESVYDGWSKGAGKYCHVVEVKP